MASLALLLLLLSPVIQNWRRRPADGFPLSYFPMFTVTRETQTTLIHPIGVRADGSTVNLHYEAAGGGGMNQVRRQMNSRVRKGDAERLCRDVAERVSRSTAEYGELVAVAIARDTYDLDAFFSGDQAPASREMLARVDIPQGGGR